MVSWICGVLKPVIASVSTGSLPDKCVCHQIVEFVDDSVNFCIVRFLFHRCGESPVGPETLTGQRFFSVQSEPNRVVNVEVEDLFISQPRRTERNLVDEGDV